MLDKAVQAYRNVVEVRNAAHSQLQWAVDQAQLGDALMALSGLLSGGEAVATLNQAAEAYRAALTVFTRDGTPQGWAQAQSKLGDALVVRGQSANSAESLDWWLEAVKAYREALAVLSPDGPDNEQNLLRASVEARLGQLSSELARRSVGERSLDLFDQAAQAFGNALGVYTKASVPEQWATVQTALATVMADRAERTQGSQSAEFWLRSDEASRSALEVFTKANQPAGWAEAQNALARALDAQAFLADPVGSRDFYSQAIDACQSALEVTTQMGCPACWASTQYDLGVALAGVSRLREGKDAADLLGRAILAYRSSPETRTKADSPMPWADTQAHLGEALGAEATLVSKEKKPALLTQSTTALRAALEVDLRATSPKLWEATEIDLASALYRQKVYEGAAGELELVVDADPNNSGAAGMLSALYHDFLAKFEKSYDLLVRRRAVSPTVAERLNVAEASLTTSRFAVCLDELRATDGAETAPAETISRQVVLLACQWGAGARDAVQTAETFSRYKGGIIRTRFGTGGDRQYLSTAPKFEHGRSLWIGLFKALEDSDGAALAEAAEGLARLMTQ